MNGGFPIREAVKKRVFYGQADRKGLNSPLYGQFFVIFFQGVHLTLDYDNMYSEEPPKHTVSIGNHENGMKNALFSPLTMK